MYSILFLTATSFILCYWLTPLVGRWSHRHGVLDRPHSLRKRHGVATPRTGGIAIAVSFVVSIGLLILSPLNGADTVKLPLVFSLLPAAAVIFATGLVDDLIGLKAWEKLLVQVCAAGLAYLAGVRMVGVAGYVAPAWLSLPITVLWLVACANAFNLIDGVDGVATGVALFATVTTLIAGLLQDNTALALATAPLAGALLAFLRYNFNPASMFLGDCGSLTIGFLLGCFGVIWSQKSATLLGMTAPLMALSVPLLDAVASVARRFMRRQRIFSPDRNHVHHRLLDRGLSPRRVALVLYGVCGLAAGFSLIQTVPDNRLHGLVLVLFCGAVWIGIRSAGYLEFQEAGRLALTGTFRQILNAGLLLSNFERRLTEAVCEDDYWQAVRDVGREFGCTYVRMSLAGAIYEDGDITEVSARRCSIRIPVEGDGYVNFRYPVGLATRYTVALSTIGEILQRALRPGRIGPRLVIATPMLADAPRSAPRKVVGSAV